jgi:soluble lytic murein transglycosylase
MPAKEFSVAEVTESAKARKKAAPARAPKPPKPSKPEPGNGPRRLGMKTWPFAVLMAVLAVAGYFGYDYWRYHRFDELIASVSAQYALDPKFVRAVVTEESNFNPSARSGKNAIGLMQVTPIVITEWTNATNQTNGDRSFSKVFSVRVTDRSRAEAAKLSDAELLTYPEINLHIGCWYLNRLQQRYAGDPLQRPMMLAGYNAGPSQAERWRALVKQRPPTEEKYVAVIDYAETQGYVKRIMNRYRKTVQAE